MTFVANITDINDKIYDAARERGRAVGASWRAEMTAAYSPTPSGSGSAGPTTSRSPPRRRPIVALIAALIERGHAYEADGDVYFRVRSLPAYGELSHRDVEQMDQGEGVEGADRKEDPLDFALWKAAKQGEDTSWDVALGPRAGRAGTSSARRWPRSCWALEFDIHGGGIDLVFPHHENEAAQTLAARGRPLARLWMHNGMLQLAEREKMSKSVGNIRGPRRGARRVRPRRAVMYFLGGHYRQPLAFSRRALEDAGARRGADPRGRAPAASPARSPEDLAPLRDALLRRAGRRLQHAGGAGRRCTTGSARPTGARGRRRTRTCARCSACSGSRACSTRTSRGAAGGRALVEARSAARAARDLAEADRLRDELRAAGLGGPRRPGRPGARARSA